MSEDFMIKFFSLILAAAVTGGVLFFFVMLVGAFCAILGGYAGG